MTMLQRRFIQGLVAICHSPNSLIPPIPRLLHGNSFTTYSSHGPAEDAERLPKDIVLLTCPSSANGSVCRIYVVGFTHNTKNARDNVRAVVNSRKPQVVFVELYKSRRPLLKHPLSEFCVASEEAEKHGNDLNAWGSPN